MLEPEDDPEYWSTMGYLLLIQGKIDQAQKYYEKALQLDPDNEGALNNLGSILSRKEKWMRDSDTCFTPQICTQTRRVDRLTWHPVT